MRLAASPTPRGKVLVIEDDADIRSFLNMLLARHGYEVETADSGLTGLATFARFMPDVIILDLAMPDMHGMTFLARRSGIDQIKNIPVIVLSARDGHDDVVGAMAAGASAYLAKPFDNAKLVASVNRLAGSRLSSAAPSTRVSW